MENGYAPEGYEYNTQTGLYIREMILPDEEGRCFLYRSFFDPSTEAYSRESYELDGRRQDRNGAAVFGRRKWIIAISAVAVVILTMLLISGLSHIPRISDDVKNDYIDRVLTKEIPSDSRFASEYEGSIEEGGIIR